VPDGTTTFRGGGGSTLAGLTSSRGGSGMAIGGAIGAGNVRVPGAFDAVEEAAGELDGGAGAGVAGVGLAGTDGYVLAVSRAGAAFTTGFLSGLATLCGRGSSTGAGGGSTRGAGFSTAGGACCSGCAAFPCNFGLGSGPQPETITANETRRTINPICR